MTDITDQDRQDYAKVNRVLEQMQGYVDNATWYTGRPAEWLRDLREVFPAPPLNLAEELMDWSHKVFLDEGGKQTMREYSARAEQLEQERDEAREEVTEWKRRTDHARAEVERFRDLSVAHAHERDEARAEVDRLTGDHIMPESEPEEYLSISLPNPAGVKPGEAWLVGRAGAPGIGVRNCSHPDFPWTVVEDEGHDRVMDSGIVLRSRLVPAPRVITDADELEQLAATSIIRDGRGWSGGVTDQGVIMINGSCYSDEELLSRGPVTVLWEPGA